MVSELLAIRLLKDYAVRELIDALSYEFYPLQGQSPSMDPNPQWLGRKQASTARVSCLEVAIRAQAKRFLSHPVVVQQLQAIWAGTVVFHSVADSLHRRFTMPRLRATLYGTNPGSRQSGAAFSSQLRFNTSDYGVPTSPQRSVSLYDPRDASLFKLSRLRVPQYRHLLSTISFAVMLVLFLAVLKERRLDITTLEIVFWFWSTGFMLDEIVGFNEQGFSLYLMSFWNLFDLGILLFLFCYYCMRLYGAVIPFTRSEILADRAYDVLAANAVLLFPRLFSTLDHYRYFSQLLIAFRIMAFDLVAVIFLVVIACSGFFVTFLSFSKGQTPMSLAFALFQMLMGFTPTAWALWDEYSPLGRFVLTIFLFICHFVVVTILITVLTNSFMGIVQNANQEHQFLFAVNTISMVKSDALFSYVAPTNIIAWLITPLRYWMPFYQFVKINRTLIKITHFPILFAICLYEKTILSSKVVQPADLIGRQARSEGTEHVREPPRSRFHAFRRDASRIVREPSVATYQKDRALEEVFRRPLKDGIIQRPTDNLQRRQTSNIVHSWMQGIGPDSAHPPDEQDSDAVDRLERLPSRFRPVLRKTFSGTMRNFTEGTRSAASNPEDVTSHIVSPRALPHRPRRVWPRTRLRSLSPHTDSEGDDELTDDDDNAEQISVDDKQPMALEEQRSGSPSKPTPKFYSSRPSTAKLRSRRNSPTRRSKDLSRSMSDTSMLHNPSEDSGDSDGIGSLSLKMRRSGKKSSTMVNEVPIPPLGHDFGSALQRPSQVSDAPVNGSPIGSLPARRRRPMNMPFELGSDLGDNRAAVTSGLAGAAPSSFSTHMAYATGGIRHLDSGTNTNQTMLSKLVLARMNNIEEGFRDVIKEVKELRRGEASRRQSRPDKSRNIAQAKKKRVEKPQSKDDKPSSGNHRPDGPSGYSQQENGLSG